MVTGDGTVACSSYLKYLIYNGGLGRLFFMSNLYHVALLKRSVDKLKALIVQASCIFINTFLKQMHIVNFTPEAYLRH